MKMLVLLDVNEDILEAEETDFSSEMGWVGDSGIYMIDSASVPDSMTNIQDCMAQLVPERK